MRADATDRLMDYLDAAAAAAIPEPPADNDDANEDEQPQRFHITDRAQFAWAMRRIARLKAEWTQVDTVYEVQLHKLQDWRQSEQAQIERSLNYFEGLIREYFAAQQAENPRLRTLTSPDGAVRTRKLQPEWNVRELYSVVEALKSMGRTDLIRTKEEIALADLKRERFELVNERLDANGQAIYDLALQQVSEDGEITGTVLPGLRIVTRPEKVYIETKPDA